MVLLIIIPMKNGYFIGNINPTFSDIPMWHGQVDKEILRGISLSASLHSGGKLWRKSPLDMPEQDTDMGMSENGVYPHL